MKTLSEKIKAKEVFDIGNVHPAYNRGLNDAIETVENHTCEWKREDEVSFWVKTQCGDAIFPEKDYNYCPYCGGRITEETA